MVYFLMSYKRHEIDAGARLSEIDADAGDRLSEMAT